MRYALAHATPGLSASLQGLANSLRIAIFVELQQHHNGPNCERLSSSTRRLLGNLAREHIHLGLLNVLSSQILRFWFLAFTRTILFATLPFAINSDSVMTAYSPSLVTYTFPSPPNDLPLALTRCVLTSASRLSRVVNARGYNLMPQQNLGFCVVVVATNRNIEYQCYEVATSL